MLIKGIILFLLVTTLVIGYIKYHNTVFKIKITIYTYLIILLSFSVLYTTNVIIHNFKNPKEWDFLCWYLGGKTAVKGGNFYNPSIYKTIVKDLSLPFKPNEEFYNQEVNIGFHYPPPTMFLFSPLGFFDYNTAHQIWITLNILFFIADIFLVWKIFFQSDSIYGILLSAAIFLLMPLTRTVFSVEQPSFIALFFVLLFWKDRNKLYSGVWVAVSIFIKPYLAILFLYYLLNKLWKPLFISILSTAVICFLSIIVYSPDIFLNYIYKNPNLIIPYSNYTEWINQSLLSTILRITKPDMPNTSPVLNPIFLTLAVLIFSFSCLLVSKLGSKRSELGISILLLVVLLLSPHSLSHYSTILIGAIAYFVKLALDIKTSIIIIPILIGITYFLFQINNVFIANLYLFIIFVWISIREIKIHNKVLTSN
jgi:hypothetical protein